jgi:hypothetical protein
MLLLMFAWIVEQTANLRALVSDFRRSVSSSFAVQRSIRGSVFVFGFVVALTATATAQQPISPAPTELAVGDIVIVQEDNALRNGDDVTRVPKGAQLRVIAIDREWVACSVFVNGKITRGWIRKQLLAKKSQAEDNRSSGRQRPTGDSGNATQLNPQNSSDKAMQEDLVSRNAALSQSIKPGYGVFSGRLRSPKIDFQKVPNGTMFSSTSRPGGDNNVSGTVTYRRSDGVLRTVKVDTAMLMPTSENRSVLMVLVLYSSEEYQKECRRSMAKPRGTMIAPSDMGSCVLLLDFDVNNSAEQTAYSGRIVDMESFRRVHRN